jgi:hypothetical protein
MRRRSFAEFGVAQCAYCLEDEVDFVIKETNRALAERDPAQARHAIVGAGHPWIGGVVEYEVLFEKCFTNAKARS